MCQIVKPISPKVCDFKRGDAVVVPGVPELADRILAVSMITRDDNASGDNRPAWFVEVGGHVLRDHEVYPAPTAPTHRVLCAECSIVDGEVIRDHYPPDCYKVNPQTGTPTKTRQWCRRCYEALTTRQLRPSTRHTPTNHREDDNQDGEHVVEKTERHAEEAS